ncbi:MAG: ABC transporter permease, partial [Acidobacteriia bacterium]|nr:ABC transporter permease [Terriglobia bacterium]
MRRILLIAKRDYLQVVTSKGYLIGLVMLPLFIGGGFLVISLTNRGAGKPQRVAILDRTGVSAAAVIQAAKEAAHPTNAPPAARYQPRFIFEEVKPEADETVQLLSLSDQIRSGSLFMAVEIPADVLRSSSASQPAAVRYYTNSAGFDQTGSWLESAVNDGLHRVRLAQQGIDTSRIADIMHTVPVVSMNLVKKDAATGKLIAG